MKLLLAADIFPPESGGPATYVVSLANELAQRGDEVKIVSLNPRSDKASVTCYMLHVTWSNKLLRYLQYFWLLFNHAKNVDVVYAMGPVNAGLPALVAARLRGKKFVVKVVGDYAWEQSQNSKFQILNSKFCSIDDFQKIIVGGKIGMLKKIEAYVARHADRVITPCEYLKRMVIGWGADEKKVTVVYNAVSIPSIKPKQKPAGEQWIVSIGRDVPWKGMKTLEAAMQSFPPNVKLKIITNASRQEALSYLTAADVFVLNSGYEGLSHVLLEAASLGISALASNVGGNPEIVSADRLFTYNDKDAISEKIIFALSQPRPSPNRLSSEFDFNNMIKKTRNVLESI